MILQRKRWSAVSLVIAITQTTAAIADSPQPLLRQGSPLELSPGDWTVSRIQSIRNTGGQTEYSAVIDARLDGNTGFNPIRPLMLMSRGMQGTAYILGPNDGQLQFGPYDPAFGAHWQTITTGNSVMLARSEFNQPLPLAGFVDSICVNDQVTFKQGQPDLSGRIWRAFRQPSYTANHADIGGTGYVYFLADFFPTSSSTTHETGLFRYNGSFLGTLMRGGMTYDNVTLATQDSVAKYAVSSTGKRYGAIVRVAGGTAGTDQAVLLGTTAVGSTPQSRAAMLCGGLKIKEGDPFLLTGSQPNELWKGLIDIGVSEGDGPSRVTLLSGTVGSAFRLRHVVTSDCAVVLSQGQVLDGHTLTGPFLGLRVNNQADWMCYSRLSGGGSALIVNGQIVAKTGDRVWVDATDADATGTIEGFRAPLGIDLSGRGPEGQLYAFYVAVVAPDQGSAAPPSCEIVYRQRLSAGSAVACTADWNSDGRWNIDDIFIFLNDWFAGQGDLNGDGLSSIDEIFIFLNIWFAGC